MSEKLETDKRDTSDKSLSTMDTQTQVQKVALFLICAFVVIVITYVMSYTISWVAFGVAVFLTIGIITIEPDVMKHLKTNLAVPYYCIFLMITLLFGIKRCRDNRYLVALVIVSVLTGMVALYTLNDVLMHIVIFINLYVVSRIAIVFLYEDDCKCEKASEDEGESEE
jgi:hypothetical protein